MRQLMAFLYLLLPIAGLAQTNNCPDFVVFDETNITSDKKLFYKAQRVVCEQQVHDQESARALGMKTGMPIPIMDMVFKFESDNQYSDKNWDKWKLSFCDKDYKDFEAQFKKDAIFKTFSDNSADVARACLQRVGVHTKFELGAGYSQFTLRAQYVALGKESVKLNKVDVFPKPAKGSCDRDLPYRGVYDLRSQFALTCPWDSSKGVTVTLTTDNGIFPGQLAPLPPEIPKKSDQAVPPKTIQQKLSEGDAVLVRFNVDMGRATFGKGPVYTVWYESATNVWKATGTVFVQQPKRWLIYPPPIQAERGFDDPDHVTTCPSSIGYVKSPKIPECIEPGREKRIVIWQGVLEYTEEGDILDGKQVVGSITPVKSPKATPR